MSLILIQLFPNSKPYREAWAFNHAQEHHLVIQSIKKQKNLTLIEFPLYPYNESDPLGWHARHQASHNDFNAVFNLQGNDLQDVDFRDEKQRLAWSWFHWQEHISVNDALGINS